MEAVTSRRVLAPCHGAISISKLRGIVVIQIGVCRQAVFTSSKVVPGTVCCIKFSIMVNYLSWHMFLLVPPRKLYPSSETCNIVAGLSVAVNIRLVLSYLRCCQLL